MSTADELLRSGDLAGARSALVGLVKTSPTDEQARMFLFQLLALAGEWDKARTQLSALAQLSAEAQMLSVAYGQAIDAELVRAKVFSGEVTADVLVNSESWAAGLAEAIQLLAQGKTDQGLATRDAAFDAAPEATGRFNDTPFEWIADCDSRFGPAFEAIINGNYGLVPFDAVTTIKSDGPVDLRDLIWYPVQIAFKSGQSIAAMLPARYPGTEVSGSEAERLARTTTWTERAWGEAGLGQHLLTLGGDDESQDDDDRGLLALRLLAID